MDVREVNVLVLAYLGDTIYENYVRRYLINSGIGNVNDLQKESIKYVSAKSQASYVNEMLTENLFLEDEIDANTTFNSNGNISFLPCGKFKKLDMKFIIIIIHF